MDKRPALFVGVALVGLGVLLWAVQWARDSNAERDAGITWVWAYSPRTMQSYLVRAKVDDDAGTVTFHLENEKLIYAFENCHPPGGDNDDSCTDQFGQLWDMNL